MIYCNALFIMRNILKPVTMYRAAAAAAVAIKYLSPFNSNWIFQNKSLKNIWRKNFWKCAFFIWGFLFFNSVRTRDLEIYNIDPKERSCKKKDTNTSFWMLKLQSFPKLKILDFFRSIQVHSNPIHCQWVWTSTKNIKKEAAAEFLATKLQTFFWCGSCFETCVAS